jgi:cytochrome c oxidase subunit 3
MSQTVIVHDEPRVATTTGIDNRKLGMWLYLATEVMLFSALIGGFLTMRTRAPADANHVLNVPITAFNTFVLIVSSTAVVMALSAIEDGDRKRMLRWMVATFVLGATFLGIQINEYRILIGEKHLTTSSLFGSGFFTVTGFHGFHVFVGVCWLGVIIVQTLRNRFTTNERDHMRFEIFGLYWHFVDVVWIVLFTIIYLI